MKKQINPPIKAYLIRSAFYLLLLLGVCAIPFALAQRQATKRAVAQSTFQKPDSAANLPEATPPATGAISAKALPNISQTGQSQLPTTSNVGAPAFAITRTPGQESK